MPHVNAMIELKDGRSQDVQFSAEPPLRMGAARTDTRLKGEALIYPMNWFHDKWPEKIGEHFDGFLTVDESRYETTFTVRSLNMENATLNVDAHTKVS